MKQTGLFILLVASLLLAGWCQADTWEIMAEGRSQLSFADAVALAKRHAVSKALDGIGKEGAVSTYQREKILSQSNDYIAQYQLLSEKHAAGVYYTVIRATVDAVKMQDDVSATSRLLTAMERPKLMIIVEEEYKGMNSLGMQIAETELSSQLLTNGFSLVDKEQFESSRMREVDRQALWGNIDAAASLGLAFGCQYVIVGKAVVEDGGEAFAGSGLRSIQASMQLKVIQAQTAALLGSVVKSGVAAHINPLTGATRALQEAARKATDEYLIEKISLSFHKFHKEGTPFKLIISGVDTFKIFKAVSQEVKSLSDITSSKKDSWNSTGGLLVLDLRFKGNSEDLANQLDGLSVQQLTLEVVDFAPDRVNCTIH